MQIGQEVLMTKKKVAFDSCFYAGTNLVAWMSKKQNSISLSTVEAKYIDVGSCGTQLLWMKKLMANYGLGQDTMVIYYDNQSTISISKSLVLHSRNKHIDIMYHFIRDLVKSKTITLDFGPTNRQLGYLFITSLDALRLRIS